MFYVPCVLRGKFSFLKGTFFYPVKHIEDVFLVNKVKLKTHDSEKDSDEFDVVIRGIPQSLIDIYAFFEKDTFEIVNPC